MQERSSGKPVKTTQFIADVVVDVVEGETGEDRKIILKSGLDVVPTDFYDYKPGDVVFVFGEANVELKLPVSYSNELQGTPRVIPVKIEEYGLAPKDWKDG